MNDLTMKFNFGDIVIVERNLVGVIVKCWGKSISGNMRPSHYEVYVRSYNGIHEYDEDDIRHIIYDKELTDEQLEYYD